METVLEIRIFFIIREMMIRNKPRIVRRIVEFFFFFSEISASISLIKNTRRGIPNYWALSYLLDSFKWFLFDHTRIKHFVTTVDVPIRSTHTAPQLPGQLALRCALCQRQRCSVGSSPLRCGMLPGSAC